MEFLPLKICSGYSFLRSGLSLRSIVGLAKKAGQAYCAVSDYFTLTGYPELTALCASQGMTPVYAMDGHFEGYEFTFVLLNEVGYKNLIALALEASRGEVQLDFLYQHKEGLLPILDLASAPLRQAAQRGQDSFEESLRLIFHYLPALRLGMPYLPKEGEYLTFLRSFLANHPYSCLALPSIRYARRTDAIALSIVEAIANDTQLEEKKLSGDQWFLDLPTLESYYTEEELAATTSFLGDIDFTFRKRRGALPHYPCPEGYDSDSYLEKLAKEGLDKYVPGHGQEYDTRLAYELSVIKRMGYSDYFLIVYDYVAFAKSHGILVGPGRGSGAGSLVSFALNIVTPDPIKYGLMFERFLNPERQSMPDIDVDFADIRRDEVASYLQGKYGHNRVSHIVTMQTLGAKASIRDIGRVYGYEPRHIDTICKTIPSYPASTLGENYKNNEAFRTLVDSDPYYLEIVGLAAKIEGLPRQAGLHAAGIVLSDLPLEQVVPVTDNPGVGYVAQYEMNYLEDQGCLKMDLLGLRNLTIVGQTIDLIQKTEGKHLEAETLPYEDPKAIALIAKGKTMGLFQLESQGMGRAIVNVKPTTFSDVAAILALYRPGPMANIPSFARRKQGKERITYLCPQLEPILKETYGILVYQEQIMQICTALAGFSYGQADLFRRAISKKDAAKLASLETGFLQGCHKNGIDGETARKVYDLIFKFADYGFNKSHAVAYAILTCQMAYLKAHYPLPFYCAILDGTSSNDGKFAPLVAEIKAESIRFRVPDVNASSYRFLPVGMTILFPLTAIKGIPGNLAYRIVEERELHGPFKDVFDFLSRCKGFGINLQLLIRFIDAGALDCFDISRASLRQLAPAALSYAEMFTADGGGALLGLDFPKPEIPYVETDRNADLLEEREVLGLMISGSPLESKAMTLHARGIHRLSELPNATGDMEVAGVVASCKAVRTKKGTRMAFLTLYDEESMIEFALFSEVYDKCYPILKEGALVIARVYKNRNREGYCLADAETL